MRPGTLIRLPDGRKGRVVYSGLDGVGIKWGTDLIDIQAVLSCNPLFGQPVNSQKVLKWAPDAMLRAPYGGCDPGLEYVGGDYEIADGNDVFESDEPALGVGA